MKTIYELSYEENDVCQVILIEAETPEGAVIFFANTQKFQSIFGIREATTDSISKPGIPILKENKTARRVKAQH